MTDIGDDGARYIEPRRDVATLFLALANLCNSSFRKLRHSVSSTSRASAVLILIAHVFGVGRPFEVFGSVIRSVAVQVTPLMTWRWPVSNEGFEHELMNEPLALPSEVAEGNPGITLAVDPIAHDSRLGAPARSAIPRPHAPFGANVVVVPTVDGYP